MSVTCKALLHYLQRGATTTATTPKTLPPSGKNGAWGTGRGTGEASTFFTHTHTRGVAAAAAASSAHVVLCSASAPRRPRLPLHFLRTASDEAKCRSERVVASLSLSLYRSSAVVVGLHKNGDATDGRTDGGTHTHTHTHVFPLFFQSPWVRGGSRCSIGHTRSTCCCRRFFVCSACSSSSSRSGNCCCCMQRCSGEGGGGGPYLVVGVVGPSWSRGGGEI